MKRIFYTLVCLAIGGGLLLASCSPAQQSTETTQTQTGVPSTPATTTPAPPATTTASAEKPQRGGQIVLGSPFNITDFDELYGFFGPPYMNTMQLTNEELWIGDWSKGPAGTNETDWSAYSPQFETGAIAESWDFSEAAQGTMIFKIRQGIHFALNPNSEASRLVNGRELTADDVVFSLKQLATNPRAFLYNASPELQTANITAPDNWTVEVQVAPESVPDALLRVAECVHIVPPEVVQKYGNMIDWHNSVGSGPWMLTDFVDSSSATFDKNPNYWGTNPVGPGKGDQLPYADGVSVLIIPDTSTLEAAFRTGRIDQLGGLSWEDGPALMKQTPDAQSLKGGRNGSPIETSMRTDKAPFNDLRVRQALMMATDFNAINQNLFGGTALTLTWPIGQWSAYKGAYLGLDDPEMPASVKQLYTYNPDQAKQLLAQAGYPNGFKTSVIYNSSDTTVGDYYAMLQSEWAKVGVDLTLKPTDYGVWTSIYRARNYDQMLEGTSSPIQNLYQASSMWGNTMTNESYANDPQVDAARTQMAAVAIQDPAQANSIFKNLMKYVLAQAWAIPYPSPASYTLWQPWLKNYYGTFTVGYMNGPNWTQWAWVDQAVKKSMGH